MCIKCFVVLNERGKLIICMNFCILFDKARGIHFMFVQSVLY